jgi:hypothetical protein
MSKNVRPSDPALVFEYVGREEISLIMMKNCYGTLTGALSTPTCGIL